MIAEFRLSRGHEGSSQKDSSKPRRKFEFPILRLVRIRRQRKRHKELLNTLFPKPVRLRQLMLDIKNNDSCAKSVASIIGSVDFAKERLASLLSALEVLAQKIETKSIASEKELLRHIKEDKRIHEIFEKLVFNCGKLSL